MQFINSHTHQFTHQEEVLEIVNQYPNTFDDHIPYFSIGIHPLFINTDCLEADFEMVKEKVKTNGCLAIGECGLDKRSKVDFDLQISVFEKQLEIAEEFQKPVILHCVNSFQELIATKKAMKITVPMIIHGFSKKINLAEQLIQQGFYLSFGKQILQNPNLELVLKSIPNDRLFLETDASDIKIQEIYSAGASARAQKVEALQKIVIQNFNNLFTNRNNIVK